MAVTGGPGEFPLLADVAVPQAAEIMVNYDMEDGENDQGYYKKKVTVTYDPEDLNFWFLSLEDEMT